MNSRPIEKKIKDYIHLVGSYRTDRSWGKLLKEAEEEIKCLNSDRIIALETLEWFMENYLEKLPESVQEDVGEAFGEAITSLYRFEDESGA